MTKQDMFLITVGNYFSRGFRFASQTDNQERYGKTAWSKTLSSSLRHLSYQETDTTLICTQTWKHSLCSGAAPQDHNNPEFCFRTWWTILGLNLEGICWFYLRHTRITGTNPTVWHLISLNIQRQQSRQTSLSRTLEWVIGCEMPPISIT